MIIEITGIAAAIINIAILFFIGRAIYDRILIAIRVKKMKEKNEWNEWNNDRQ